jgi:cob(I)alamin adenosyltransferase
MSEKAPRPPLYTKTGDRGDTGLFDGTRVSKADSRVDAYGEVDELNAWLGVCRSRDPGARVDEMLTRIQRDLFAVGATLADPRHRIASRVVKAALTDEDIARLEQWIDEMDGAVPPLRRFILPGGSAAGATLHLARTVCRRAERRIIALGDDVTDPTVVIYMNRLSDLLFAMARAVNHDSGAGEIEW